MIYRLEPRKLRHEKLTTPAFYAIL